MTNGSRVILLRGQINAMLAAVKSDEDDELSNASQLHWLADAAEDLTLAIRDRIGDPAEAYDNASQGGP